MISSGILWCVSIIMVMCLCLYWISHEYWTTVIIWVIYHCACINCCPFACCLFLFGHHGHYKLKKSLVDS